MKSKHKYIVKQKETNKRGGNYFATYVDVEVGELLLS